MKHPFLFLKKEFLTENSDKSIVSHNSSLTDILDPSVPIWDLCNNLEKLPFKDKILLLIIFILEFLYKLKIKSFSVLTIEEKIFSFASSLKVKFPVFASKTDSVILKTVASVILKKLYAFNLLFSK